jgi:hypothetical protein
MEKEENSNFTDEKLGKHHLPSASVEGHISSDKSHGHNMPPDML